MQQIAGYALSGAPNGGHGLEHVEVHRAGDIAHAFSDQQHSRALGAPQFVVPTEDAVVSFMRWAWETP